MKIFVYLLATICSCNATFFSKFSNLFHGKGGGSRGGSHNAPISYHAADHGHNNFHGHSHSSSHDHGNHNIHNHGSSPRVIKVILLRGGGGTQANSGDYSYASSQNYGSSGYGQGSGAKIFKVIRQSSAGASGLSHGSGYSHGGAHNYNFQLYAVLPQILQLIMQSDASNGGNLAYGGNAAHGGDGLYSQIVAHFGESGSAVVKRSNGHNDYYSSGRVIQKGELKIKRLKETSDHSSHGHGW